MTCSSFRLGRQYLGSRPVFILTGMIFLAFLLLFLSGATLWGEAQSRIRTDARITDKGKSVNLNPPPPPTPRTAPQPREPFVYWFDYSYQDLAGQWHTNREYIGVDRWNKCEKGGRVPVEYVRRQPNESRLTRDGDPSWWLGPCIFIGIGTVILVLSLLGVASVWKDVSRLVHLVCTGSPAVGMVTHVAVKETPSAVQGASPKVHYHLQYCFTSMDGREHSAESRPLPNHLKTRWRSGDRILILYQADTPSTNEPDVFGARADEPVWLA
jgi:hypothetical protein